MISLSSTASSISISISVTNPNSHSYHPHHHSFAPPPPHLGAPLRPHNNPAVSIRCTSSSTPPPKTHNNGFGYGYGYGYGYSYQAAADKDKKKEASEGDEVSGSSSSSKKLKIGIIGFGNFGQFMAKTMVKQGHTVLAYSRSDYSRAAHTIGVRYFFDADDLCEEHPEVILLCTSILSTERVLRSLPLHRLRRSTLIADVLSVKEFPRSIFLQLLPPDFDILCTHPMFGPDSGKAGWGGLPFVFDKVRVGSQPGRLTRVEAFLDIFRDAGCRMVEMSCAEHDRHAAGSQFITHMMGRVLEKLALEDTPINTKGYESLLNLVDNTARDSFELFYGLFLYNKNAMEQLDRMHWAFETVKQQLSGYLHVLVRRQLMLETSGNDNNNINIHSGDTNKDANKLMLPSPGIGAAKIAPPSEKHDLVMLNGKR